MGMFDDLHCEVPLPDGYEGKFQTKDFDCELALLTITAEGELWRQRYRWLDQPELEREKVDYHGLIRFYGYDSGGLAPLAPHDETRWHEYEAKFTDGRLVEIVGVPPISTTDASGVLPEQPVSPTKELGSSVADSQS